MQRLSLTVLSNTPQGKKSVHISPMAWTVVSNKLAPYEIIDVVVKPDVILEDEREAEYEPYVPELKTSSPYLHPNDALALPKSRTPSPDRRSPSPSVPKGRVKGWLERVLP